MEKHISKKFFAGLLALSAGFILASCDPVSAVPTNYNDPIVSADGEKLDLDGNNLGTLYDAITTEKNAKIVEDILTEIAQNKFGTYGQFLKACQGGDAEADYIKKHADFFNDEVQNANRFALLKSDIQQRISEYFYNEITSGSYNDDLGRFSEEKLYNAHRYELYDLDKPTPFKEPFFVDKELNKNDIFDKEHDNANEVIHESIFNVVDVTDEDGNVTEKKRGYIQEKVYKDILRDKLVEDYIYTKNPASLGRAYGRKINYVKISYEGEAAFADSLSENFAKTYVETAADLDFTVLENAYKGFKPSTGNTLVTPLTSTETDLISAEFKTAAETITVKAADAKHYVYNETITLIPTDTDFVTYKETKLGKILAEYAKAIEGEKQGRFPTPDNKAALDSFTSDGKSKEYGLFQKLTSLIKEDYTTDGWFVKNGGASELPSAIRDRLFNIRVANSLDDPTQLANEGVDGVDMGAYEYVLDKDGKPTAEKATRLPYVRKIQGKNLILPSKALSYAKDNQNYIYHDVDGKAFYMCEVLEAPSTAKLNTESSVYKTNDGKVDLGKIEAFSRQIAKILGTKDSYIKDAYTQYLNKFEDVKFYDTSLYEYMKSEYPDLDVFED